MTSSTKQTQPLGNCQAGFSGQIIGFLDDGANGAIIDQLREMGFSEGLDLEVLHQNPFGKDPIAVKVGAMTVALRRAQASFVEVEQHD